MVSVSGNKWQYVAMGLLSKGRNWMWIRHCRSSRACPMAFIALSVHHVFIWPLALFVFQTVPGPCLPGWVRAEDFGFWALPPGDTTHLILSLGCGIYSVLHVWVVLLPRLCLLALAPLGHTPLALWSPRVWRARGERSRVSRFAATNPGESWWSLGLKAPVGTGVWESPGTYNIQFAGGVQGVGFVLPELGVLHDKVSSSLGPPIDGRWCTWSSLHCTGRWPCPRTLGCRKSPREPGGGRGGDGPLLGPTHPS